MEDKSRYATTLEKNIDLMQQEHESHYKALDNDIKSCLDLLRKYKGNQDLISPNKEGLGLYIDVIRD